MDKDKPQQQSASNEGLGKGKHDHEHHKDVHETEQRPDFPHDSHDHKVKDPPKHTWFHEIICIVWYLTADLTLFGVWNV